MIIEQCRAVGCYYGVETETTGNFLCVLYVTHKLPSDVLARLHQEVHFPFSEKANKLKLDLFQKKNSRDLIEQVGLRKVQAPRANFSNEEDLKIISLQKKHGNRWVTIAERINKTLGTDWSKVQVINRFTQLEVERKQGGRKRRKAVNFSKADDAQIIAFRDDWLKTHETTYGMWKEMATKMLGKTNVDLRDRFDQVLSRSSAVTSTAVTLTAVTSLAESLTAVSKKAVAKKVTATKVAPSSSDVSDGYSSSEENDGYSSSDSEVGDAKLSGYPEAIRGLSKYELRREENIARNKARLAKLGLGDKPIEAKKKVIKKRKSLPVDAPRRELPGRQRTSTTYNEDEYLADLGLDEDVEN